MQQSRFPYRPKKPIKSSLPAVPLKSKGVELQTHPNAWISDGPIRDIERGLPVLGTLPPALDPSKPSPMEDFVSMLVNKPYLKDLRKMYGSLINQCPDINLDDPDNLTSDEKQFIFQNSQEIGEQIMKATTLKLSVPDEKGVNQVTTGVTVPLNAYLYTYGGAIPYFQSQIFVDDDEVQVEVCTKPKKVRTGIHGPAVEVPNDSSSLIRDLHFKSIPRAEIEANMTKDDSPQKPLHLPSQHLNSSMRRTKLDTNTIDSTVKDCMSLYFPPEEMPFVPKNVEKLFPLLFGKNEALPPALPSLQEESNETTIVSKSLSQVMCVNVNDIEECDPKSTLLDPSDQDILFTPTKAPFRRHEIATMRAFASHWDNLKIQQKKKFEEERKKRNKYVQKAFQSREVMETYMKLLHQECVRCRSGLIGKSPFKNKSMWQVAYETAPKDPTSLGLRMNFWWRFCIFVGETQGVKTDFEIEVAKTLRELLMNNHAIDKSLFIDLISCLSDNSLQSVGPLKLIEFLRLCLGVSQKSFQKCLDSRRISLIIYNQTILTNLSQELLDCMHRISKMPVEVPDPSDLL